MTTCAQASAQIPPAPAGGVGAPARTLILCGDGFSAGQAVEFQSAYPEHEIWTMNAQRCPEATRHFDIHFDRQPANLDACSFAAYHGAEIIISPFQEPAIPETCFPLEAIFLHFGCALFQRTLCYMLALAAWEHASGRRRIDRVCLPGHDFASWPHFGMRDGPHLWLGILRGQYITPLAAKGSSLGRRHLEPWRRLPPADYFQDTRVDQPHMYGQPREITAPFASFYGWE